MNHTPSVFEPASTLRLRGRTIDYARHVDVMGIVNRTPDSFYDRGLTFALDAAIELAHTHVAAGASWIDVGGVPFGPGPEVTPEEEIARVVPFVEAIRELDVVISVETTRASVAEAALAAGGDIINDTSGLYDPDLAGVIAQAGAGVVLVHSAAPPRVKIQRPTYADVVGEVRAFLVDRVERALAAGIGADQIVVDPGHDLHKNTLHSLELTRELHRFADLGHPLLVAVSNKDFIGEALDAPLESRVAGTVAVAVMCLQRGARILRVHNVAEVVSAVRAAEMVLGWQQPTGLRHNV